VYRPTLRLFQLASPLLLAIAIVGYLVGHRHGSPTPARVAYGKSVLLEYPTGWQQVSATAAPNIPGLPITGALVLAPGGDAAGAGLISGQIPANATSQLPSVFLSELHGLPHTEVVDLLRAQAYRYDQLTIPGYAPALALYAIPTPGSSHTVLACYAPAPTSSYMQQCQRIVASLTLAGERPGDLTPEAAYAGPLDQLIKTLSLARSTLRSGMRAQTAASKQSRLASDLAHSYATAVTSLSALEPPAPVEPNQAALTAAMVRSQLNYEVLAAATLNGDRRVYLEARARIGAAEASVNAALQGFALVGYGSA
jgi:hypothetical protein